MQNGEVRLHELKNRGILMSRESLCDNASPQKVRSFAIDVLAFYDTAARICRVAIQAGEFDESIGTELQACTDEGRRLAIKLRDGTRSDPHAVARLSDILVSHDEQHEIVYQVVRGIRFETEIGGGVSLVEKAVRQVLHALFPAPLLEGANIILQRRGQSCLGRVCLLTSSRPDPLPTGLTVPEWLIASGHETESEDIGERDEGAI